MDTYFFPGLTVSSYTKSVSNFALMEIYPDGKLEAMWYT